MAVGNGLLALGGLLAATSLQSAGAFTVPAVRAPAVSSGIWGVHPTPASFGPSGAERVSRSALFSAPVLEVKTGDRSSRGDGPEQQDPFMYLAQQFETVYNRALDGKPAALKALFASGGVWGGLPWSEGTFLGIQDAIDIIDQGRSFMLDPRLTVVNATINRAANQVTLEWILSGTWPLPYRPRVSAVGSSVLSVDPSATITGQPMVQRLTERWEKPWWKCALEQALPRFWDVWHLYLTPPAERPLYRVLKTFPSFELREYYPRLVLQLELADARNLEEEGEDAGPNEEVRRQGLTDLAWCLPDFAFTDELKLQGRAQYRETYVTTSPLEVAVESVKDWRPQEGQGENGNVNVEPRPAKKITWQVAMPTQMGFNVSALPGYEGRAMNASWGEGARYVVEGRRVMAVRPFKGMSQTPMYAHARRLLLRFVNKEGLNTVKNAANKSKVWVLQRSVKAGWNLDGHLCLAIYEQPSFTETGEIAVQIDCADPEAYLREAGSM